MTFSPRFYTGAAICSALSTITTLMLIFLPRVYGPPADFDARIALVHHPAYVLRAWAYLVHPFLVVIAAVGVAASLRRTAGGARRGTEGMQLSKGRTNPPNPARESPMRSMSRKEHRSESGCCGPLERAAVQSLLYGTAIRGRELEALKLDDLDLDNGRMIAKRRTEGWSRIVFLTRSSAEALRRYLEDERPKLSDAATSNLLFLQREALRELAGVAGW